MLFSLRSTLPVLAGAIFAIAPAVATTAYDNLPGTLPGNLPSQGYQATQTFEAGWEVGFGGTGTLNSATLYMSSWALQSDLAGYPTFSSSGSFDGAGYDWPLTLNIYDVSGSGASTTVGPLLGSVTQTFHVPWRPASAGCVDTTAYLALDGNCYHGFGFEVTFNLGGLAVPADVVYGLAFNTQTYGTSPVGYGGPFNSLNFGLVTTGPSVGADPLTGGAFWNTNNPGNFGQIGGMNLDYLDAGNWGAGGGTFYEGAISFDATVTPEPSAFYLGVIGIAVFVLRRRMAR
jgi:hypothetical protein